MDGCPKFGQFTVLLLNHLNSCRQYPFHETVLKLLYNFKYRMDMGGGGAVENLSLSRTARGIQSGLLLCFLKVDSGSRPLKYSTFFFNSFKSLKDRIKLRIMCSSVLPSYIS